MGQNFLIDESVLEKIIAAAEISQNDTIMEIGPGLGILTIRLAEKAKKVIAIEKDGKLAQILNNELGIKKVKNVEIIQDDILKIQSANWRTKFPILNSYKIVANLPYYITSPVIRMFLEIKDKPETMILMVQKEVAQRICAKPPQMSILAVAVQFYARPEIISEVSKISFYPQPKVDSAIIKITPRINTNSITNNHKLDTKKFFELVKAGFSSKRKFLINNLSRKLSARGGSAFGGKIKSEKLKTVFEELDINQKIRAENLKIDDWIRLYGKIEGIF